VRNEGASLGIALVATLVARRSQLHQSRISEHFNAFNPIFQDAWDRLAEFFQAAGYDAVTAQQMALGKLYQQVQQQAQSLAYFDLFFLFSMAAFAVVPLVLLMKRSVSEKGAVSMH
jgi:DHA2 family multidrug resistance protein